MGNGERVTRKGKRGTGKKRRRRRGRMNGERETGNAGNTYERGMVNGKRGTGKKKKKKKKGSYEWGMGKG